MKNDGKLANNILTATTMSNIGLEEALKKNGIKMQRSDVGDRYVLEMMQNTGSVLGGEQSGHVIFLDGNTTGDGIYAGLRLLEALSESKKKASEIATEVTVYPQVLKGANVKNENKYSYNKDEKIAKSISDLEEGMKGKGRVIIRASGTEPLVRVMIEGEDIQKINKMADKLVKLIEDRLR